MPSPTEHLDRIRALDRLTAAGATWDDARAWALKSGRWLDREVERPSADVIDAYLAARPTGPACGFDALFASPAFWAELVDQAEEYGPQAPPEWSAALAQLASAGRALLALVDTTTGGPDE